MPRRAATPPSARCWPGSRPGSPCSRAANWIFGANSETTYRWLLLGLALAFALASLVLRGGHPRHAELMIVTGGLAILAIFLVAALGALFGAVLPFGIAPESGLLPGFWELVLLVAGCGLVAYGAVDRVPGAAWLGVAQLAGFVIAASAATTRRCSGGRCCSCCSAAARWPPGCVRGCRCRPSRRATRSSVRSPRAPTTTRSPSACATTSRRPARLPVMTDLQDAAARALAGGPERHREKAAGQGKLPVRERVAQLLDPGSFSEDALLANWEADGLGADGVVTGMGAIGGRTVALMANDPTVKAGSWGPKTVEKILRIQEAALAHRVPMVYLVDSAGARITDQVQMFPGRRHAGRIFFHEVQLSGAVPQVCVLFGPSAAGGAYIPAFCDVVIMREGNASMYLGSPRMAEMVIGEHVSLEEMGGARMHTGVSGCGHFLVKTDEEGIALARRYLGYFPSHWEDAPPPGPPAPPPPGATPIRELIPADENKPWDMRGLLDAVVDEGTFLEVHARWAKEVIVGYARLDGRVVGIVANQPKFKGGVLFVDSADKAARFIWTCNAFGIPLLFLADVPGFMIGTAVERQGIIRHGAKLISAVSEATVPKLSVIVRKAYGAGLYAMAGPAFEPDACIALPTAKIAVMGPSAAVNAVFYNQLAAIEDEDARAAKRAELMEEYAEGVDLLHLASELVIDAVVQPEDLRDELIRRYAHAAGRRRPPALKRHGIPPA